ncbi:putative bifunctional diguanylate cyclase/phosphodiesterase [Planosporangium mesophilum]|uniref:putative bifunctional diguanylate cyclase/phosphodiesterase n=1 Tax=Planosporangium mesophilum TaxID=689768 RepID=UPI0035714BE6
MTEIPLLLSLFYLPPLTVLTVRMVAAVAVKVGVKLTPVKYCFNLATKLAGTALAGAIVFRDWPFNNVAPRTWLVLAAAAGANVLVSLVAVIGVITLVQGRISRVALVRTAVPGLVVAAVNLTVGLVVLLVLHQSIWSLLLLAGLGVVFVQAYRSYGKFLRQHKSLNELYALTRAITESGRDGVLVDPLLARLRELLSAEYATLWMPASGRHPEMLLSARADYRGLLDIAGTPDSLRSRAMERGETILVGPQKSGHEWADVVSERGVKDAIIVPMRSGDAVIGTLEVVNRLGEASHFTPDDVRLLETVAAQAGVAVENSRLVERLRFDAQHDALTGLPNRRRILSALGEAIKVQTPDDVVAVLLFDVVRLRHVNDSLGHAAGDRLLAEVGRRLRDLAPPAALVGRVGGNEFALTVRTADAEAALALAVTIRESLQGPMAYGVLTIDVDCAVGVAVHPDHAADSATLLQYADVATHAAKGRRPSVQLFTSSLESRSVRRVGLANDLRQALDEGDLRVYFQPKVGLRDRRLVGVECLARWEHPVHGAVAPEDFVMVAEHTGQLGRLTEVVLGEGLRRVREWEEAGRALTVSVNLSPRTLLDPAFPAQVAQLLGEYGVDPARLTLEIAEGGVDGDPTRALATLHALRDLGVRLSVDDFGTGYTSLAALRRLPVQEVKIDRTFVQGMATDPGDLAIVRTAVDMARNFGLTIVAEGVESERTLGLLEDMGCDVGQGFLFSRPLPYERLNAWYTALGQGESTAAGDVRWLRAVQ